MIWRALLVLAVLIGAWEVYVAVSHVDPVVLPAPHAVFKSLYTDRSVLWSNFLVTAEEVVLGILVAALAGLALATGIHFSSTARRTVYPLLVGSQAVPIPIFATLLVFWLGFGILPKLLVVALVSFFSIVVATLDGLAAVDPELLKLMRTFDSPSTRTFRLVELPGALPSVFTGAKIAVAVAVIGAVFAELSGASSGLGYLFEQSFTQLLTARAYAAAVILCLFAIALFALLTLAQRLLLPWAYESGGRRS